MAFRPSRVSIERRRKASLGRGRQETSGAFGGRYVVALMSNGREVPVWILASVDAHRIALSLENVMRNIGRWGFGLNLQSSLGGDV